MPLKRWSRENLLRRPGARRRIVDVALVGAAASSLIACGQIDGMNASNPARGPGQMVGNGDPVSDGNFEGGDDPVPDAREVAPEDEGICDAACEAYCEDLDLENPVNKGICGQLWGAGYASRPIDRKEACRRLWLDMVGRVPTPGELNEQCSNASWSEVVKGLLETDEFAFIQQRRWADKLLYNNRTINLERAWDMDDLVRKAYRGLVGWDLFAAVTAAHPILVRRHDTAGDRVEAVFRLFLARPPYDNERSDMARLYAVWDNDYLEHAHLGVVPDAYIRFACTDEMTGQPQEDLAGPCTSILWGYNQVILARDPDRTRSDGLMWSGTLKADEWELLQTPGRLLSKHPSLSQAFWEAAVDDVLKQYYGFDFGTKAPKVRDELRKYLLQYNGDIRAAHFAVATSIPYLQSMHGGINDPARPWRYGPLKQMQVEPWIDSIKRLTGYEMGQCDHRLPHPEDYLEPEFNNWAYALVKNSRWVLQNGEIRGDYRNLAQTLGGCPTNEVNGRFTTISILNTAMQEGFVVRVCGLHPDAEGVPSEALLPEGIDADVALTSDIAEEIFVRQMRMFFGRDPNDVEIAEARAAAGECSPQPCRAVDYARPVCFALLSSSEMLFY